jgi:hypothetical protein
MLKIKRNISDKKHVFVKLKFIEWFNLEKWNLTG